MQRQAKQQAFALTEVVRRRALQLHRLCRHAECQQRSERQSCASVWSRRKPNAPAPVSNCASIQTQFTQYSQVLASLKAHCDAKRDMLKELGQGAGHRRAGRRQCRSARPRVATNRMRREQQPRSPQSAGKTADLLQKPKWTACRKLRKRERDYHQLRERGGPPRRGWCAVMRLVKDNGVERRLHRRERWRIWMATSCARCPDKALGALRLAVADNEHLRDVLRLSEDPKRPERKIQFCHIGGTSTSRKGIRQDIIRTDDPVEAIEQMEIELGRLTEELTARASRSWRSVRKRGQHHSETIQREQNRIRMLNPGLQAVSFGQVKSVRLNVNVREAHATCWTCSPSSRNSIRSVQQQPPDLLRSVGQTVSARLNPADRHGGSARHRPSAGVAGLPQLPGDGSGGIPWLRRLAACGKRRCLPVKPSVPGCQSW
ncbi:hypothetical protein M8494_16195 [Serratia ureilytica]